MEMGLLNNFFDQQNNFLVDLAPVPCIRCLRLNAVFDTNKQLKKQVSIEAVFLSCASLGP